MKSLMVLMSVLCLGVCNHDMPNIPVDSPWGGVSYVDPEKLLEASLYAPLRQYGVVDVDVDDVNHDAAAFKIKLYSRSQFDPGFQQTFEKILRSDLGLNDVTVKSDQFNNYNPRGFNNNNFNHNNNNFNQNNNNFNRNHNNNNRGYNNYRSRYGGNRVTYYVYFNPSTMVDQMKPLAKKTLSTMNLSLEDSMWD